MNVVSLAELERYWEQSPRALAWAKAAQHFTLTEDETGAARMWQAHLEATLPQWFGKGAK